MQEKDMLNAALNERLRFINEQQPGIMQKIDEILKRKKTLAIKSQAIENSKQNATCSHPNDELSSEPISPPLSSSTANKNGQMDLNNWSKVRMKSPGNSGKSEAWKAIALD